MSFKVVIPARFQSTRLPGKPLVDIAGAPMVQHVHQRAVESGADEVVVATDDERVAAACETFGARVVMTAGMHRSGTERIAEVVALDGDPPERIVVNVQGDEPLLPGAVIRQAAAGLEQRPEADIATLCEPIEHDADAFDPSVVKVVCDAHGFALYFSRATIPWYRDHFAAHPATRPGGAEHLRHVGIYAYRAGFLERYVSAPESDLERAECLEQLRALHMGARVHVAIACDAPGPGVDTPGDLERVRALFAAAAR
jgi:3-deoxy-manno-octulosonate cytidylyltransferase (CMP-KDO synthetase)